MAISTTFASSSKRPSSAPATDVQKTTFFDDRQHLSPDHPDLASVWTNLGALYTAQARYGQAESVLQKALAHEVRVLGPDRAANFWTLKEYANLLRLTKRKAEAGRMELRAREVASLNEQLSFLPSVVDAAELKKK